MSVLDENEYGIPLCSSKTVENMNTNRTELCRSTMAKGEVVSFPQPETRWMDVITTNIMEYNTVSWGSIVQPGLLESETLHS